MQKRVIVLKISGMGNVPSFKTGKSAFPIPIKGSRPCPVCHLRRTRPMVVTDKAHKTFMAALVSDFASQLRSRFLQDTRPTPTAQ